MKTRYLQVADSTVSAITSTSGQKDIQANTSIAIDIKMKHLRSKCNLRSSKEPRTK
jgi:hypothetical protein